MLLSSTVTLNNTTPTLIMDSNVFDGEYVIHLQFTGDCVIGDSNVTTTSGFLVKGPSGGPADNYMFRIQGESLFAVSVAATELVGILAYSA